MKIVIEGKPGDWRMEATGLAVSVPFLPYIGTDGQGEVTSRHPTSIAAFVVFAMMAEPKEP